MTAGALEMPRQVAQLALGFLTGTQEHAFVRLFTFGSDHPNVIDADVTQHCAQVRVGMVHRLVFATGAKPVAAAAGIDLVIRYSLGDYPNLYGQCLLDECFAVYGAPDVVARASADVPTLISVQGAGYSALCVPGRERHPPVRAFFQWVQAQAKLSGQAL